MSTSPGRERGLTFLSFLILLAVIGFFTLLVVKIVPVYLDHYKVVSTLEALKSDKNLASRSKDEILKSLEKRWDIDMIDSVTKNNVIFTKSGDRLKIQISYDVAKPILGNVDAVMHFDDFIEVASN
jgi:hypothetical protein